MTIPSCLTINTQLINSSSLWKRLETDFELKNAYQATIEKDLECTIVQKFDQEQVDKH